MTQMQCPWREPVDLYVRGWWLCGGGVAPFTQEVQCAIVLGGLAVVC